MFRFNKLQTVRICRAIVSLWVFLLLTCYGPTTDSAAFFLEIQIMARKKIDPTDDKLGKQIDLMKKLSAGTDMGFIGDIQEELVFPTAFTSLNRATGVGGFPARRVVLFHGQNQTGKSALAIGIADSLSQFGFIPAIFESEHSAERDWYKSLLCGESLFDMPEHMDGMMDKMQKLFDNYRKLVKQSPTTPGFCFIVDTITKLDPKKMVDQMKEKGVEEAYAMAAKWRSRWLVRDVPQIYRTNSVLLLVTQERDNQERKGPFDKKSKPVGGQAIQFDNSLRIHSIYAKKVKRGNQVVGMENHFQIEKNKVAGVAFEEGCFYTSNGRGDIPVGFDHVREAVHEAEYRGHLKVLPKTAKRKQCIQICIGDKFEHTVEGGKETIVRYYRENSCEFCELVDALNEEVRKK
jgi:RecA/RadA recombinase